MSNLTRNDNFVVWGVEVCYLTNCLKLVHNLAVILYALFLKLLHYGHLNAAALFVYEKEQYFIVKFEISRTL